MPSSNWTLRDALRAFVRSQVPRVTNDAYRAEDRLKRLVARRARQLQRQGLCRAAIEARVAAELAGSEVTDSAAQEQGRAASAPRLGNAITAWLRRVLGRR